MTLKLDYLASRIYRNIAAALTVFRLSAFIPSTKV